MDLHFESAEKLMRADHANPQDGGLARRQRFVSVVAPIMNEQKYIVRYLESLAAQTYPRDRYEVLLVDGGSTDRTLQLVGEFSHAYPDLGLRVWKVPGISRRASLNFCVQRARGKIITRLDGHSFPAPDYLCQLDSYFTRLESEGVAVLGGPVLMLREGYLRSAIGQAMRSRVGAGSVPYRQANRECDVRTVQNASYLRRIFDQVGLFDEAMLGGEDDEFNWRVVKAGFRIFITPALRFSYSPRDSMRGLFRQFLHYGRGRVRVIRKHPDFFSFRYMIPPLFVLGLLLAPWLCWLSSSLRFAYAVLGELYLLLSIVAATIDSWQTTFRYYPIYPFLYLLMHTGYGLGELLEVLHIRKILDDSDVVAGCNFESAYPQAEPEEVNFGSGSKDSKQIDLGRESAGVK